MTRLAQARQNRSGKRELDLTDYLVGDLTGFIRADAITDPCADKDRC